ncbi:chitin synthase [Nematocida homosporus]|uniref:chitin synthase n=1 Tax=Nematocida homosporus TaxID=1912981 RepID=UPI0022211132|nr:chitin synthase [Nematocida homosporus]KAI5186724.1 chitin synthase [Nematocida homosporus]
MENNNIHESSQIVQRSSGSAWVGFSALCTSFIPGFILRLFGVKSKEAQSAWREKVVLCWMIIIACCFLAFITYGMTMFVCIPQMSFTKEKMLEIKEGPWIIVRGKILDVAPGDILSDQTGADVSRMFKLDTPSCQSAFGKDIVNGGTMELSNYAEVGPINYTWSSVLGGGLTVIGSSVYNLQDAVLPPSISFLNNAVDATRASERLRPIEMQCLRESCYAGELALKSVGCQITDGFLYISCVTILSMVISRFVLAVLYSIVARIQAWRLMRSSTDTMPVIMMTACYSEGREGLKATLDSLCLQDYTKKLIVVVADGFITGSGNEASTPDILKSMIRPSDDVPSEYSTTPQQYISIAAGAAKLNHAEVHAGTYTAEDKRGAVTANIILILKTENRGKRDSQMVVMNFFHRILYKTRLTQLDQALYRTIKTLTGLHPSEFGAVLMVDADTSVRPNALRIMARTMQNDENIMGLCGETLISNKLGSWVAAIQVFEYYASHHLTKGFESIFGNVTCLPGCFCMYRIKVERGGSHAPILVAPSVLHAYGSDETKTLHEKNLLLLGEDRYLTTLLLKNFPKRKLVFLPNALCDTIVPDRFSVLLSQRRRWINSTIHNLFELLKVDLCGTFFCSMQFIVVLELFGTIVLPAAIIFTGVLILTAILIQPVWIPLILLVAILGLPMGLVFVTNFNPLYFIWFVIYLVSLPIWNFVLPVYAFWHFDDFSWGETRRIDKPEESIPHGTTPEKEANTPQAKIILTNYEEI